MEIIRLESADSPYFKKICDCCYAWWGTNQEYSRVETNMIYSLNQGNHLPQTFIAVENKRLLGFYQLAMNDDIDCRPDCYPWLINVYVLKKYRNQGVCQAMMNTVKENAIKAGLSELYLYTKHQGLYEKFGWELMGEIDTYHEDQRIQLLYHLNIKNDY